MSDASARIQDMMRKFEEQAQKATELQSAMQDLKASASSPDGAVKVTVAPSGAVLDLQLSPSSVRKSHAELQQSIMAAIRAATQNASEQLNSTVAPILGDQFDQFQEAFNVQGPAIKPDGPDGGAAPESGTAHPTTAQPTTAHPTTTQSAASQPQRPRPDPDADDDFSDESFLR